MPLDNSGSERNLRPLVVSRKVSGGTRSARGIESKMALASLFGTWQARNLNSSSHADRCSAPLKPEQLPGPIGLLNC